MIYELTIYVVALNPAWPSHLETHSPQVEGVRVQFEAPPMTGTAWIVNFGGKT